MRAILYFFLKDFVMELDFHNLLQFYLLCLTSFAKPNKCNVLFERVETECKYLVCRKN